MPRPAPAHKSFADRASLYQDITDKIIAELVPWVQPWRTIGAPLGLPRSAATGHAYSGINILILWSAAAARGFTTQTWLTFRQALKIRAHVRKGERGIIVGIVRLPVADARWEKPAAPESGCRRNFGHIVPRAEGGMASRAIVVGIEVMTTELERVVDPTVGGEETRRMTR